MDKNKGIFHGAAGYDAVARRKIKELEKKIGPQMVEKVLYAADEPLCQELEEALFISPIFEPFDIVPGRTYIVTLNGKTVESVAKKFVIPETEGGGIIPHIGNVALSSGVPEDDTGEDFVILWDGSGNGMNLFSTTQIKFVKISVLEEKLSGVVRFYSDESGLHCSETYSEAKRLIFECGAAVSYVNGTDGKYYSAIHAKVDSPSTDNESIIIYAYQGADIEDSIQFNVDGTFGSPK